MTDAHANSTENGHARPGRATSTAMPEVLAEILRRIDELHDTQGSQIARIQEEMISWREVNQTLTQLLHAKSEVTQEVSDSYTKLVSYLTRFSTYLAMSEATLTRVEAPLLNLTRALPALSENLGQLQTGTPPLQPDKIQMILAAIAASKAANQELQSDMQQTLYRIQQNAIAHLRPKNATSIWTELANWRAALVWVGVGAVATAGLLFWVFRGSGFQQAMRAMQLEGGTVDARLERIEIWLGIEGDYDETPDFEAKPLPKK